MDSNFVEHTIDANGDLYLKYHFADTGVSDLPNSDMEYLSFNKEALDARDNEAVGLPFAILPRKELSLKKDFHPWHPKGGAATWDEHVAFAKSYSPGHIVAITKDTQLTGASIDYIKQNNGRFAIVKITDQRARDAFRKDPSLIPKQVSAGYLNYESPNYSNVKNFKWVHLAAVPRGAFHNRSTVYASCLGGNECVNHLVGASVAQLDSELKNSYCPVGASENISSLHSFNDNSQIMSDNANTVVTPTPVVAPVSPTPPTPKGAPITTGTPQKGIVRLKDQKANVAVTPQGNQPQEGQDDVVALREQVAKMQEIQAQAARREEIKRLIPKEPFIKKGKFDEKTFEAEVDKRLQSGETDQQITDHYNLLLERDKLIAILTQNGQQVPGTNPNAPQMENGMAIPAAPTGGSSYTTPSDVPGEPTGGSANAYVTKNITELLSRTLVRRNT